MLFTLKQNCSWQSFISTICFFPATQNLMAVTYSGIIKTWDMYEAFQNSLKFSVIKDINQYNLALQTDCIVRYIVPNLTSNKHFLLISAKQFFIYDSLKIIRLTSTDVQLDQCWAGGDFLGNSMVIMWDKNGTCYLYAISNTNGDIIFDSPLLYAIFHTNQHERGLSVTMLNYPYENSKDNNNMDYYFIFQGCIGGRLTFWQLPSLNILIQHVSLWCEEINDMTELIEQGYEDEYKKIINDHIVHMNATFITDLKQTFDKVHPPSIINKIDNGEKNPVCCSIILTETGFIAAGRTNGNITLIPALKALCYEFLQDSIDSNFEGNEYCNLIGHTAKISYLFYPYEDDDHYQPQHLLSGSADFTVRLWDIITLTQLSCFCCHAGLITKILTVPVSVSSNSRNLRNSSIVTIGSDHVVNVINIETGRHILQANSNNSPIQTIKWRIDEELMLICCGDGIIYIWQLRTGQMDRCVSGNLAIEILETFTDESDFNYSNFHNQYNGNHNLNEKNRNNDKKLSKVASSLGFKFSKSNNQLKTNQLRVHRHHIHSNHHIHLSSLKKNKLKRRSFKIKNTFKSIQQIDQISNILTIHSKQESRSNEIQTTTLNMASQPLSNLTSTMSINQKNFEINDDNFASKIDPGYLENVSYTNNQYLPFNMISARTSYSNDDIHVLLFDPDAIIRTIRHLEETLKSMKNIRVAASNKYFIQSNNFNKEKNFTKVNSFTKSYSESKSYSINDIKLKKSNTLINKLNTQNFINNFDTNNDFPKSKNNLHMKSCFKYLNLAVAPPNNIYDYSKYMAKHTYYHSEMIRQTIQLLVSSLSGWGLDEKLDYVCKNRLHLSSPSRSLCFGLISYGKLVAQLPPLSTNFLNITSQNAMKHWESSKTMLTQHIMTIVSIATSLLSAESSFLMDYIFSRNEVKIEDITEIDKNINDSNLKKENILQNSRFSKKTISSDSNMLLTYFKSGWSILANFYCYTINSHVFQYERFKFRGLILHELIRHWLSFNTNIREASQCLLLSELTRLGFVQVSNLIQAWEFFLPDNVSFADSIFTGANFGTNFGTNEIDISYPEIQNSLVIESGGLYGFWPTPKYHRAILALYMISFIICELFVSNISTEFNVTKLLGILPPAKISFITQLLMDSVLLESNQKVHYPTPVKRASIWLIGRGFKEFEKYLDLSLLITNLLDIVTTSEIIMNYHSSKQPRASKLEYIKAYDVWKTTQQTLIFIATQIPSKIISIINVDVIKNVSNGNMMGNIFTSSVATLNLYNAYMSNNHKKINNINELTNLIQENVMDENSKNSINLGAIFKKEIFRIVNYIFEFSYNEISEMIIETVDIALQCLNPKLFKGKSSKLFQHSKIFSSSLISYNEHVKKLAVGTIQGKIALFDVRTLKLTLFLAHDSEIDFISFSEDGKYLVSFSKFDQRLKTWHSQFSLIGLINNPFKQHNNYLIIHPDGDHKLKDCELKFDWIDSRHITIFIDQNQFSFVV